jgi:hypothetical protein
MAENGFEILVLNNMADFWEHPSHEKGSDAKRLFDG